MHDDTTPSMTISFAFRGGSEEDPQGEQGRAHMMASLLTEGTTTMPAIEFQQRLNDYNITLGFEAGRESIQGTLRFLTRYQGEAVTLARAALMAPAFRAEDLARLQQQMLAVLKNSESDPEWRAQRLTMQQMYGGTSYGHAARGTPETLPNLKRESITAAWTRHLTRARLVITAIGAPSPDEAAKIIDNIFGDLPDGSVWQPPAIAIRERGTTWYSLWEGSKQNSIMFSAPALLPTDADYPAALVLTDILGGGGFRSLLMDSLRQTLGATYGSSLYIMPLQAAPAFMGQTAVVADKTDAVIGLIRRLWAELPDNLNDERIKDSVTYITGSLTRELTSAPAIADYYLGLRLQHLPSDHAARLTRQLQALTIDDLRNLAKRLYTERTPSFVVVGPVRPAGTTQTITDIWAEQ
ncbi:MAG: M16 family metallopeptidase [Bdellovibrionales bacterium]